MQIFSSINSFLLIKELEIENVLHFLTKGKVLCISALFTNIQFSSVQSLTRVWLFATPWTTACQASLSITNSRSTPKPMSIVSVMPSNHLILCRPLLLLPSISPSITVFSNESVLRFREPNYWSSSFSISLSNEYSGLISFRIDWLDLLAVQGTLKSLLQHHSSKASILRCSAFFMAQLSHPYNLKSLVIFHLPRALLNEKKYICLEKQNALCQCMSF